MRATLVYNPWAGDEQQHTGEQLLEKLEAAGYEARLVSDKRSSSERWRIRASWWSWQAGTAA